MNNRQVVLNITQYYGSKVQVDWIDFHSTRGREKIQQYNLTWEYWNSIIINYEVILKGGDQYISETQVREVIDYYLTPDIAIVSVVPASSSIPKGEILNINVTTKNEGGQPGSFNVTVYCNTTLVGKLFVNELEPKAERLLVFQWDTIDVDEGIYILSVHIDTVQNETDKSDNVGYFKGIEVRAPSTIPSTEHDVAVISIIPSQEEVNLGEKINFTITVRNYGTETENFNLTLYSNDSLIGTLVVSNLISNETRQIIFPWDTSNITLGNYNIKARAELASDEDISDNECLYNKITVKESYSSLGLIAMLISAFTFGFFETFSPCLIIMLSFILSYTIGKTTQFKTSFLQVMLFAIGFLAAAMILGVTFGLMFLSISEWGAYITITVCIFAILFGFNLLGVLKIPLETKPLTKKVAKKYVVSQIGIVTLGFIFYFLDPCIAPIFVAMIPLLFSDILPLILFIFCIGALIPFFLIGIFAGSISKLARSTYKHRNIIRGISGLILISYALYLIFLLLPHLLT